VRAEHRQVSRCWHPDAIGETLEAKNGSNIAVLVGEAAYQFSDGDIVTL